jgi:transcriptional regulator with XRE-family HTH domain
MLFDMPGQSIGERIAWARERAGLNKNRFARELGTSWQHVDHWEKGRTEPSLSSMRRIAELLGVSIDFLLGVRDEPGSDEPRGLAQFLEGLAPPDLTEHEAEWLRSAPVDAREATPEDYLRLLENLRGIGATPKSASTPPRSGRRRKVDPADVARAVQKRGGGAA